jgi:hypothetical protein
MFRNRGEMRQRLQTIIQTFRQKGATSPEKAMTIQELGLPPRFEQAMHRRLGQTGIFIEVNGKYYLSEERLKQIQEQRQKTQDSGGGGSMGRSSQPSWTRYIGILLMLPIGLIVAVVLFYFVFSSGAGYFPGEFLVVLLIVMVGVAIARIIFWQSRRKYWRQQYSEYQAVKGSPNPTTN